MKQSLVVSIGLVAALVLAMLGLAGPAAASAGAGVSATTNGLVKQAKAAKKNSKKVCRKARAAKGKKTSKRAKKRCGAAREKAKKADKSLKNHRFFDVCRHGCTYRTVQAGINDAGLWQLITKRKATVRIQPGTYVEGTFMFGTQNLKKKNLPAGFVKRNFDGLTIMGVEKNGKPLKDASKVHMEGLNAKTVVEGNDPGWRPGDMPKVPAQNAIEARNVQRVTLKNMYGSNYQNNGFFVWASVDPAANERCSHYTMDNLLASGNRAYGLFGRKCTGGKMLNSTAWNSGDSGFYIGETPCDKYDWNNHGFSPKPCQAEPDWSVLDNDKAFQNTLGFSGTNAKYIEIKNSAFYNNGAGIVPNDLDSEHYEPPGWLKIHNNDVFWNNYNYFCTGVGTGTVPATCGGSTFHTVSGGLGELLGQPVNFPTGVGVMLYGTDSAKVYNNNIFGNEKWGVANFSSPVESGLDVEANVGDDGKSLNNQFIDNKMGRDGLDPNGFDFLYDSTGGGNCWQGNTANPAVTYVMGTGPKTQAQLYNPSCPGPRAINDMTDSFDGLQGIQVNIVNFTDPNTILGYAGSSPPDQQECSWATPATATGPNQFHPTFKNYVEKRTDPAVCAP